MDVLKEPVIIAILVALFILILFIIYFFREISKVSTEVMNTDKKIVDSQRKMAKMGKEFDIQKEEIKMLSEHLSSDEDFRPSRSLYADEMSFVEKSKTKPKPAKNEKVQQKNTRNKKSVNLMENIKESRNSKIHDEDEEDEKEYDDDELISTSRKSSS